MPPIDDCDLVQDAKRARETAPLGTMTAAERARAAFVDYSLVLSSLDQAVQAREKAEADEKDARKRADEAGQTLAAAIHAAHAGKKTGDKYHAMVCGHLFLVHAYPCHKDGSKTRFYLERQEVARID